jgi:hypothetical protein
MIRPEVIIVDFWSEIESSSSSPPKIFSLVEPVIMTSSAIRYTIRRSEERLLVSFAQQIVDNPEGDSIPDVSTQAATVLAKFDSWWTPQKAVH